MDGIYLTGVDATVFVVRIVLVTSDEEINSNVEDVKKEGNRIDVGTTLVKNNMVVNDFSFEKDKVVPVDPTLNNFKVVVLSKEVLDPVSLVVTSDAVKGNVVVVLRNV